jgi:hypothetical protein
MELTDLEICKRIAEIEGLEVATPKEASAREYNDNVCVILPDGKHAGGSFSYNPLTDDALCFQLMVKDKIRLVYEYDGTWLCFSNDTTNKLLSKSSSPNKAACLAKIELNK